MATVAERYQAWVDLTADLVARPSPVFPRPEVVSMLRATFQTRVSYNWIDADGTFGFELDDPIPGWPDEEERRRFASEGMVTHPLICWYARTGSVRPMTVGRVPRQLVPEGGHDLLRSWLAPHGLDQQLSIPLTLGPSTRTFVLAQTGEDYSAEDLALAGLVQPMVAVLDRQTTLLGNGGHEACMAAGSVGLTGRETVVLQQLAEGRTAHAIAHTLEISPHTVHTHLEHLYRKLGVSDRLRAVLTAQELGLLRPAPGARRHDRPSS